MNPLRNPDPGVSPPGSLCLAAILVVIFTVYAGSLRGPFVWDDHTLILGDAAVRTLQPLRVYFTQPFWQTRPDAARIGAYYRPLTKLSYALDHRLWGPDALPFRTVNLLLHLLNASLVFLLARRAGAGPVAAALASGLWALLPRLAESVAWVSGRTDLLATAFTLAALLAAGAGTRAAGVLAALLVAPGLLCKETALAAVPALAAWELRRPPPSRPILRRVAALVPVLLVVTAYFALRHAFLAETGRPFASSPSRTIGLVLESAGTYAKMVVDPFHPGVAIGNVLRPPSAVALAGLAAVAAAIATLVWLALRAPPLAFAAGCLSAASISLVLHVLPMPGTSLASDRFLYLPLAGAAVAAAGASSLLPARSRTLLGGAAALLTAGLAFGAHARCLDWADELRLWSREVRRAGPGKLLPKDELASFLFREGRWTAAAALWQEIEESLAAGGTLHREASIRLQGSQALCFARLGREDEAVTIFRRLEEMDPSNPAHGLNVVRVEISRLQFDDALREAARLERNYPGRASVGGLQTAVLRAAAAVRELPAVSGCARPGSLRQKAATLDDLGARGAAAAWRELAACPETPAGPVCEAAVRLLSGGAPDAAAAAVARCASLAPAQGSPLVEELRRREERERRIDDALRALGLPVEGQKTAGSS